LSSLNWVFRIPILLIITLRGEPGLGDEPQHELMGQITGRLLDDLQIPWDWFPRSADAVEGALTVAQWQMDRSGLPYAFIMKKGTVEKTALDSGWSAQTSPRIFDPVRYDDGAAQLTRRQVLGALVEGTPTDSSLVIATTGYTGRELFAIDDRPNQLYMVGSMGCASSFGLGLSLALPKRQVVVADGDGAALMRMGNFATAGAYGQDNFRHLVLDNGVHESTGGQPTVSAAISFAGVARACGYREADTGLDAESIRAFLAGASGPSLLHMKISLGVPEGLPRPDVTPRQVKRRLMHHIGASAPWRDI